MPLFKLILNYWPVKKRGKRVKKLEFSYDGVTVIEALSQYGGNSSFELFDSFLEFVNVILELSLLNIHDVIFLFILINESFLSFLEITENSFDTQREMIAFGVSDFNFIKGGKLGDSVREMCDVLTSLLERVQSNEKSICSDLPLVFGLLLIFVVAHFEFPTNLQGLFKLFFGGLCLFI